LPSIVIYNHHSYQHPSSESISSSSHEKASPHCDTAQSLRLGKEELTTGSKLDILSYFTENEKTIVEGVAGILYLRDGGGVVSNCR
jgi:hypothetical protein